MLETERLILKEPTMNEQKRLWELLAMPKVNQYYLTIPILKWQKVLNNKEDFIKYELEHAREFNVLTWSIFLKENNKFIGRVSCYEKRANSKIKEVGWLIDPNYQNKGYATEAAKAMIDYIFTNFDITKINAKATTLNIPSWKVMEKLGFTRLKETKKVKYTFLPKPVDVYLYSLSKEKWLAFKKK